MQKLICILSSFVLLQMAVAQSSSPISIIPQPVECVPGKGVYRLKNKLTVKSDYAGTDSALLVDYLKAEMKSRYGITVVQSATGKADFTFAMRRMPTSGKPAYRLNVDKNGIVISSNFSAPAFHAIQTLFQLISSGKNKEVPFVSIFDHARFEYRGMHLDVARHFFPVSFVKKYIDYLAAYKFNIFHWHLTDDQGWRIEIKKYPELTAIGSIRNGTIIGRYPGKGNDNISYGGYYTQEEIKEVVQYAKERFIDVIPEIEMPGHASAAIASFPWLSCFPAQPTDIPAKMISAKSREEQKNGTIKLVQETWGVFDDVFCAGNDSTFMFLQNVIDEVIPLFPVKYFHIGGDESPKTHWKICPKCQQRIKDLNLKDEHELQSWFVQKIEKHLNSKDRTLIGWDEILEGGLAPNAVVMSWRGEKGGIDAAKQKHQVIMTPGSPLYFDHSQSENEDSVTIGGYNPIEKVYAYNPIPAELTEAEGKYILGAQANLWTEYIDNGKKIEYMLVPRLLALSEVLWSPEKIRTWKDFEVRLMAHYNDFEKKDINYSKAFFGLQIRVEPSADKNGVMVKAQSKIAGKYFYEIFIPEGYGGPKERPKPKILLDTIKRQIKRSGHYIFALLTDTLTATSGVIGLFQQRFDFNHATGKEIKLLIEPSGKYPGDGPFTLVNGIQNRQGLNKKNEFLGFEGTDCEVIIDLGEKMSFRMVTVNTLTATESWIYPPKEADFTVSDDGINFVSPGNVFSDIEPYMDRKTRLQSLQDSYSGRYIKVIIKNYGKIPAGKPGAGNPAWLFVDEIEVK